MTEHRDRIYSRILEDINSFQFDEHVASVFSDMIQRSVPGYQFILEMTGIICQTRHVEGTRCYDLGCSLGASTLAMRHAIADPAAEIIAVDNAEAMTERCQANIDNDNSGIPVTVLCEDIMDTEISNASIVVMNFTLQFIPRELRMDLLTRICEGLVPGGVLVLSEKIEYADVSDNVLLVDLHHAFKKARGYSDLEIAQKRSALENVLVAETFPTHKTNLVRAGFSHVTPWFQCFNFASFIAIK